MRRTDWSDVERALALREPWSVAEPVAAKAAVALALREGDDGLELLFISRADHPLDPWSGHMAFPGGRREQGDADLLQTAVRETSEEIGVDLLRHGESLGALDETRAVSRMRALDMTITPFVFRVRGAVEPTLGPEVTSLHWVALDDLLSSRLRGLFEQPVEGHLLKFPCFRVQDRTIWGLTYRMFGNLQSLIEEAQGW